MTGEELIPKELRRRGHKAAPPNFCGGRIELARTNIVRGIKKRGHKDRDEKGPNALKGKIVYCGNRITLAAA